MSYLNQIKTYIEKIFWPSMQVGVRVVTVGLMNKCFAVLLGPASFGVLGNYLNLFQMLFNPTSGALSNTVLKYSDRKTGTFELPGLSGAVLFSIALNFCFVLFYFLTHSLWSKFEIDQSSIWVGILLLGCVVQPLFAYSAAFLNGLGKTKEFVIFSILYSVGSMTVTIFGTYFFGFIGALLSLVGNAVFATLLGVIGLFNLDLRDLKKIVFQKVVQSTYFGYLAVSIVSATLAPFVQMGIRKIIAVNIDLTAVGYWQGLQRISELYMSVVLSVVTLLYLPDLASAKSTGEVDLAVGKGIKTIVPTGVIVILFSIVFAPFVIEVLLSHEFTKISDVGRIFFAADMFKVISFLGAYFFIARGFTKIFIMSEVLASATQLVSYYYMTQKFGLFGISYAQILSAFIYAGFCVSIAYMMRTKL